MSKAQKITYWISTVWLSFGLVSSAIFQLIQHEQEKELFDNLGYPHYLMFILGVWKLLAVVSLFLPKMPVLKEWTYAGIFFFASGAALSHLAIQDGFGEVFPGLFFVVLTGISWYFRPESKKVKTQ